jgi:MinD superfamily P-loop ATPase
VPCGVVINRDGVGDAGIEDYCSSEGIPVLLRIPHERRIAEAYSRGETLAAALPEWREPVCRVYDDITRGLPARRKEMQIHATR